jgi:hypothetical protein
MTRETLPFPKGRLPIWRREEIRDFLADVGNRLGREGDGSEIDVDPKADDLELQAMLLFPVLKRAVDRLPRDEKLDLASGMTLPSEEHKIVSKVPAIKIIHVNVQVENEKLLHTNPA